MLALTLALTLQAATITPEAETLGRRLAESGTLGTLAPMLVAKDTEELIAAHPELSAADKATLRGVAEAEAAKGMERLMAAEGHAFATAMSLEDLRVLVAAAESGAAKRQRAALPGVIAATMQAAGGIDFKRDTLAAFCTKTGKACPTKK